MNAANKYQITWEELNEKRLRALLESSFEILKASFRIGSVILSLIAFTAYRAAKVVKFLVIALALAQPIIRVEREEAWLFRQIK